MHRDGDLDYEGAGRGYGGRYGSLNFENVVVITDCNRMYCRRHADIRDSWG